MHVAHFRGDVFGRRVLSKVVDRSPSPRLQHAVHFVHRADRIGEVLDEVGLDDLTMRTLADRLSVKAASLYRVTRRNMLNEARRQFKSLPAGEYPTLVDLADHITEDDQDGLFQFGIEMCLRGIVALVGKKG